MSKQQFYIENSSIFDSAPYYNKELISKTLINAGLKNVHLERQFGWRNQPEVVVFTGNTETAIKALKDNADFIHPLLKVWGPIVSKRNWRKK